MTLGKPANVGVEVITVSKESFLLAPLWSEFHTCDGFQRIIH